MRFPIDYYGDFRCWSMTTFRPPSFQCRSRARVLTPAKYTRHLPPREVFEYHAAANVAMDWLVERSSDCRY